MQLIIIRISNVFSAICSMRLDFETFTTTGPTVTNDNSPPAGLDSFIAKVSPGGFTAPTISGENKGQHSNADKGFYKHC